MPELFSGYSDCKQYSFINFRYKFMFINVYVCINSTNTYIIFKVLSVVDYVFIGVFVQQSESKSMCGRKAAFSIHC